MSQPIDMNILIDINHPAHVHLYRNVYKRLVADGHQVVVVVKDIPAAKKLLDIYAIPYIELGTKRDSIIWKGLEQLIYDWRLWKIVHKHHIDIGFGSSINIPHVSRISNMTSIICDDDDDAVEPLFVKFAHPFADVILTPNCIQRKAKQTFYYSGYHDLAYLHPNVFTPDPSVLDDADIKYKITADGHVVCEPFFIMRFNAFKAHHDVGAEGLTIENKRRLIKLLSAHGKVFITTERNIEEEFLPYQMKVSPEKIHSFMHYATMFVGDSQSMTSEAAVLGTPAIKCNSFAGRLAVPNEIENKYQLCYSFLPKDIEKMFEKIEDLLRMSDLKKEWATRRKKLLADKIDVTSFFTWLIENYPTSVQITSLTLS